jgi:putative membrane protein
MRLDSHEPSGETRHMSSPSVVRRVAFLGVACALTLATIAGATGAPKKRAPVPPTRATTKSPGSVDQFVAQSAGRSLAGVELSELALQRSENAAVRRLARRAHDEHAHTYETLLALATGAGVSAAPPDTIDLEQRGIKSRLTSLQGRAFDEAYVAALRSNDERDIALYRSFAHIGKDEAFTAWINEQLTTIRKRRQLIDSTVHDLGA